MSTLQDLNQVLSRKQDILENAAGVEKIKKSGKLTARERVALLLDDSPKTCAFLEILERFRHGRRPSGVRGRAGFCRDGRRCRQQAGEEGR